jgi:hypothetical protein
LGFLELKRTSDVLDLESIGQVVSYGEALLRLLGLGLRRKALVGVTDLKTIQWILITFDGNTFQYQVAPRQNDVRASLYAVLRSDWADKAGLELPEFKHDELLLRSFLGSGSSGVVFHCTLNSQVRWCSQPPSVQLLDETSRCRLCGHRPRMRHSLRPMVPGCTAGAKLPHLAA